MKRLVFSILILSRAVWASDPVRPATDAEIASMDAKMILSMGLESAKVDGKEADAKFYSDFFDLGQDYLPCIDRKPLKFVNSKLTARFSVSNVKGKKPTRVEISFLPNQKDYASTNCLKKLVADAASKFLAPTAANASGDLVFKYSRPLKYDSQR